MTKTELLELIGSGENSGVEFKRDDVRPDSLAKEMSALLNLEGGHILLGVEDDGGVVGLTRESKKAEEMGNGGRTGSPSSGGNPILGEVSLGRGKRHWSGKPAGGQSGQTLQSTPGIGLGHIHSRWFHES